MGTPPVPTTASEAAAPTTAETIPKLTDTNRGDQQQHSHEVSPPDNPVPYDYSLFGEPLPLFNYLRALEIKRPRTALQDRTRINDEGCTAPAA